MKSNKFRDKQDYDDYVSEQIEEKEKNLTDFERYQNQLARKKNNKAVKKYSQKVDFIKLRLDAPENEEEKSHKDVWKENAEKFGISMNQLIVLGTDLLIYALNDEIDEEKRAKKIGEIKERLKKIKEEKEFLDHVVETEEKLDYEENKKMNKAQENLYYWKYEIKDIMNSLNNPNEEK